MHLPTRFVALLVLAVLGGAVAPAAAADVVVTVPAPTIVPFEDWAPAACPRPTGADVAATDRVVLHHSHHPIAATPEQVLPALAEMCRIHVARGFDTVGYHYVVDPWGTVYQARGRLPGADGAAPTAQPEGAHVHGSNPGATGVVLLGDHETTPPTDAAVDAAVGLLAWLVEATGRDPSGLVTVESTGRGTASHAGHVEVEVLAGHEATNATLCPGRHVIALLDPIRDRVRNQILAGGGTLRVSDAVRAAPDGDGEARLASAGPIAAAPPLELVAGPHTGAATLLAGGALLAVAGLRTRRRRADGSG